MTVKEFIEGYEVELLTDPQMPTLSHNIKGGYVGDLLSFVMSHAKEDMLWMTIQGHLNSIAVASLVGVAALVLTEKSKATEEMIEKANEQHIPILSTPLTSFELAYLLGKDKSLEG